MLAAGRAGFRSEVHLPWQRAADPLVGALVLERGDGDGPGAWVIEGGIVGGKDEEVRGDEAAASAEDEPGGARCSA
jgi:hypothetical protein